MSSISREDLDACLRVLQALVDDREKLAELDEDEKRRLLTIAGRVSRPTRQEARALQRAMRKKTRQRRKAHDADVVAHAFNRQARRSSAFLLPASTATPSPDEPAPPERELLDARNCYVCKAEFRRVHHFYDQLCPACAELNWQKRRQSARLDGRVALVTGARIKIGYQAALLLLRAGATVIVTTRFPNDAALRFAKEPDFSEFSARLQIHGIDLRDVPGVEQFASRLVERLPRLDFLINNAAQTVRRPPAFYQHLYEVERQGPAALPPSARPLLLAGERALPTELLPKSDPAFPPGAFDLDGQQVDLRIHNSWRMTLADVPTVELLEVHLVNAIAPFVLTSRLKPLLVRDRTNDKHVVNVSAMEAQFARNKKTDKHPHTNMAKAALNMMTRTSAVDYAEDGIFMNSVDTGWITDEDPLHHVARKQVEHDFHPPLDAIDGAARVLDPIFTGFLSGHHMWGLFLKDYQPVNW